MDVRSTAVDVTEVTTRELPLIEELNREIFQEDHVIHSFDRDGLLMLLARVADKPVGFKVGYRTSRQTFYSAKGGVLPAYRGDGIARELLHAMIRCARSRGYARFVFDTFPNKHPGMTVLGLKEGFRVIMADFHSLFGDYRLRFEKEL